MPVLFVFLLKVNIALVLFCAGYYAVLRHLTFYTLNRVYLVAAIIFSTLYPQINISSFADKHQALSKPVQDVVVNLQAPAKALITPLARPDYWRWVEVAFWIGAAVLAIRLLMQLYSLFRLYRNSKPSKVYDHDIRVIDSDAGPFSFWNNIYVNPANHEPADLKAILLHEQVHVSEWHTLDILLAELSTIFYWFNPGVWLMKKAVRENIEFITDRKILKKGIDTKSYQYSLVNVSFAASVNPIVNHFNISTIKKRIIMMNAKRSSNFNLTRYLVLIPAVVVLLLVFTISQGASIKKVNLNFKFLANTVSNTVKDLTAQPAHISKTAVTAPKAEVATAPVLEKIVDTVKKGNVVIGTTERADSLTYVINGVKAKKSDFKNLDPDKIYSIEMLTGEQANKLLNEVDGRHNVLFVTTDDSDAGKKFKEKIDRLNEHSFTIASNVSHFKTFGPDSIFMVSPKVQNWKMKTLPRKFRVNALKRTPALTSVNGTWILTDSVHPVVVVGKNDSILVRKMRVLPRKQQLMAMTYTMPARSLTYTPRAITLNKSFRYNDETNIDHLSSKLIMINGKEASEHDLKKLSAADIESMSVRSGEEVVKQYGEKAKDGVLFIETKKKK